jgi:hypothetical protein
MIFQGIFDFPMGEMSCLPVSKSANFVSKSANNYFDTYFYVGIWRLFIIFASTWTDFYYDF